MYIRYIYKLHDLHVPAGNFTEAAFTLQLHANQLSWTQRMLHADHLYPAQTETQRKELIYMKIIDNFDKGKVRLVSTVQDVPLMWWMWYIYRERGIKDPNNEQILISSSLLHFIAAPVVCYLVLIYPVKITITLPALC